MVGVSVGDDRSCSDVGVESGADEKFVDARANKRIIVVSVSASPSVIAFLRVSFTPDVDEVVMRCNDIKGVDSTLPGVRVSAKFIQFRV